MNAVKKLVHLVVPMALLLSSPISAHEEAKVFEINKIGPSQQILEEINHEYISRIQPIFREKCFDCHSNQTRYPWYYVIPGIKQMIDGDIEEAREHIDMTNGFPFKGHGTPGEDLEAIREEITEGDMPPWGYRRMHPKARLSTGDREIILRWINQALLTIN